VKEPVDHILRPSLPWRDQAAITECGLNAASVKAISREAYLARRKELGQQRAAMLTCMTCGSTATRYCTWDEDPRQAVAREVEWEGCGIWRRKDRGQRLHDELVVIGEMISERREEFDRRVAEIEQRREWNEMKATRAKSATAKKPPPSTLL
jgi:hypothetical protein